MSNKKYGRTRPAASVEPTDKPATLKDLLGTDTVSKLKQHAEMLKQQEAEQRERQRAEAEEARKAELKRKENDFEYLLNHSRVDGKKFD